MKWLTQMFYPDLPGVGKYKARQIAELEKQRIDALIRFYYAKAELKRLTSTLKNLKENRHEQDKKDC
jgi:hypothetical protein